MHIVQTISRLGSALGFRKQRRVNILCCATPFQMFVAERILDRYPGEPFYLILHSSVFSAKDKYYFDRLKKRCKKAYLVQDQYCSSSVIKRGWCMARLVTLGYLFFPRARRVFISSVAVPPFHLLLGHQRLAEVVTFDDGLQHIAPISFAKKRLAVSENGKLYNSLRKLLKFDVAEDYLGRSRLHYTVYELPNVMPNVEYLPLWDPASLEARGVHVQDEWCTIMLGQPIYEYEAGGEKRNKELTQEVVRSLGISRYLPHPRETYRLEDVEYIETGLIFEDYIIQELAKHPNRSYRVYSYCSSSILNFSSLLNLGGRLEFVSIKPRYVPEFLLEAYTLIEQAGITIIPFNAEDNL